MILITKKKNDSATLQSTQWIIDAAYNHRSLQSTRTREVSFFGVILRMLRVYDIVTFINVTSI
jgi:hypothetical protein